MPMLICPNCDVAMTQLQRSGVELDMCPQCRGVWLDRGELEKLLQPLREADAIPPTPSSPPHPSFLQQAGSPWVPSAPSHPPRPQGDHHRDHGHHGGYGSEDHGDHHKRKGWRGLLDVFD